MKDCIQKTNEQLFGSVLRFLVGATTTREGQRSTLFVAGVMCLVAMEMFLTVVSIAAVVNLDLGIVQLFPLFGVATVGAGIMVITVVYAATLYDNCNPSNGESE